MRFIRQPFLEKSVNFSWIEWSDISSLRMARVVSHFDGYILTCVEVMARRSRLTVLNIEIRLLFVWKAKFTERLFLVSFGFIVTNIVRQCEVILWRVHYLKLLLQLLTTIKLIWKQKLTWDGDKSNNSRNEFGILDNINISCIRYSYHRIYCSILIHLIFTL